MTATIIFISASSQTEGPRRGVRAQLPASFHFLQDAGARAGPDVDNWPALPPRGGRRQPGAVRHQVKTERLGAGQGGGRLVGIGIGIEWSD